MIRELLKSRIIKNTLHLIGERGISLALSLFVGIYVVRYLGPDKYGLFSYVMSFAGILLPFASLGYATITIKELVRKPALHAEIMGTALGLNILGSALVITILNALAFTLLAQPTAFLVFLSSLPLLFRPLTVIDAYFQSIVYSRFSVIARTGSQFLLAGLKLLGIFFTLGLSWFIGLPIAGSLLTVCILIYFYRREYGSKAINLWKFDRQIAKSIAIAALPLVLTNAFNVINLKVDKIIIKELLGDTPTGLYSAAALLSETWYFLPGALLGSLFPRLVQHNKENPEKYYQALESLCSLFFYIALIVAVIIFFTADFFMPLLMGEEYAPSASTLKIHIWAGIFVFLGRPVTKAMIIEGLTRTYLSIRILAAVLNVAANYYLIPRYGIDGAAIATLFSYLFAHVVGLLFFAKARPFFFLQMRSILRPFVWSWNQISR